MANRYDFWTHGIATIIKDPEKARTIERRGKLGTRVEQDAEQDADSDNWFYIPITTPTVLANDTTISLKRIGLKAKVNENARVSEIHIRNGATDRITRIDEVPFTDTTINSTFDIDDLSLSGPEAGILVCIKVEFLDGTPRGRVEFRGAGGHFL